MMFAMPRLRGGGGGRGSDNKKTTGNRGVVLEGGGRFSEERGPKGLESAKARSGGRGSEGEVEGVEEEEEEDSGGDAGIGEVSEGSTSMGTSLSGPGGEGAGGHGEGGGEDGNEFLDADKDLEVPMDDDDEEGEEGGAGGGGRGRVRGARPAGSILGEDADGETASGEEGEGDDSSSSSGQGDSQARGGQLQPGPEWARAWPQGLSAKEKAGEAFQHFEACVVGGGLDVNAEATRITAAREKLRPAHEWGLEGEEAWMDEEMTDPRYIEVPSYAVWGPTGQGGVHVYHLLVEVCLSGNLFVGCIDPNFDVGFENWPYHMKDRSWMLCDGGSVYRTGADCGGCTPHLGDMPCPCLVIQCRQAVF